VSFLLKAGLGTGRSAVAVAAVLLVRFEVSVAAFDCVFCRVFRTGVTAATGAEVENRRALFRHCRVPRARLGSMLSGCGEGFQGQWQWEVEVEVGE
jgi:hypothetical protein